MGFGFIITIVLLAALIGVFAKQAMAGNTSQSASERNTFSAEEESMSTEDSERNDPNHPHAM